MSTSIEAFAERLTSAEAAVTAASPPTPGPFKAARWRELVAAEQAVAALYQEMGVAAVLEGRKVERAVILDAQLYRLGLAEKYEQWARDAETREARRLGGAG